MSGLPLSERMFAEAVPFLDSRGHVWQRLRNGKWRSTEGCPPRDYAQVLWAPEPPSQWGPYIQVQLMPIVRESVPPEGGGSG